MANTRRPRAATPAAASLSFARFDHDGLCLWALPPAQSYAHAHVQGARWAAEFAAFLAAEGDGPRGLLFQLMRDLRAANATGPQRGYEAGFFFALEGLLCGRAAAGFLGGHVARVGAMASSHALAMDKEAA
jgi:hypothetical protein